MGDFGRAATGDRAGGRILVVDDEAAVRRLVEMALTRAGYLVECPGRPFSPRCRILAKPFLPRDLVAFVAGVLTASS
jgi:DNA-binding response OmpR family regulator